MYNAMLGPNKVCQYHTEQFSTQLELREGVKKKREKSGQADRFGGGGVTPLQPDRFYLWKF